MKKFFLILIVFVFVVVFCVSASAHDISVLPVDVTNYGGYIITHNDIEDIYYLYLYSRSVVFSLSDTTLFIRAYDGASNSVGFKFSFYAVDFSDPDNDWVAYIVDYRYSWNNPASVTLADRTIIYSSSNIVDKDTGVMIFDNINNSDLSNTGFSTGDDNQNVIVNIDVSGIINGLSTLNSNLTSQFNSLSNSLNSSLNNIFNRLNDTNIYLMQLVNNTQTIIEGVQISISDMVYQLVIYTEDIKSRTVEMRDSLLTLPEDIAEELDYLLNPENENLEGSFGSSVGGAIEDRLPIITDVKSTFNSLESQNSPIVISHTIKIGKMQFPFVVDFSFYEPYRLQIRSAIGGLFWVMCLIACWSTISGIFGIGVKSGVSAYMAGNEMNKVSQQFNTGKGKGDD